MSSGKIWQRRSWDHAIRDETDLNRHVDYIHYNPVKHKYVRDPGDWRWSSFAKFQDEGFYPQGWGLAEPGDLSGDYGE